MTTEPDRLEVMPADRQRAADVYCDWFATGDHNATVRAIRDGERDDHLFVQAFARHRIETNSRTGDTGGATGWRPIETAPKDGTFVDLWKVAPDKIHGKRIPDVRWDRNRSFNGGFARVAQPDAWVHSHGGEVWLDGGSFSHWRPLPAAPQSITPPAGLDYERRILAAECGTQRILNELEDDLRRKAHIARTNRDALDFKAAEILSSVADTIAKIDVITPDAPITSEATGALAR